MGKNNTKLVCVKIELELETLDNINSLFKSNCNTNSIQLYDDEVEITLLTAGNELSFGGGVTAELLLIFSVGVASRVVGNFIFSYLCNQAKKLTLNNQRTLIKVENITRVIETTKITETTKVKKT